MEVKISGKKFNTEGNKLFWYDVSQGKWEPETFKIMERFLDKEHCYLDIGAWIGPTVLFGAQLAKKCYAFEPDPEAMKVLEHNLDLNPKINNVITRAVAISNEDSVQRFGSMGKYGNSMSSLIWKEDVIRLKTETLLDLEKIYSDCNFIKMDIEGGEFYALPIAKEVLAEKLPTLYLSLHPDWFVENKFEYYREIIDVLKVYPNIYTDKGEKIIAEDIITRGGFYAIIATKETYEKETEKTK